MSSLLTDTAVVYAHVVLPTGLEDDVPAINRGWGGFAGGDAGDEVLALLGSGGRPARFEDWVRSIHPSARPALSFKHVLLPHVPWQYLPDGPTARSTSTSGRRRRSPSWSGRTTSATCSSWGSPTG